LNILKVVYKNIEKSQAPINFLAQKIIEFNIAIKRSDRRSFGWSGELGSERNRLIAVICLPSKLRGLRVGSALREQVQVWHRPERYQ